MSSDGETTTRLRDHLRLRSGAGSLDYLSAPQRVPGGFETDIFRLELRGAPPAMAGPLILRRLRPRRDPRQARFEAAVQSAVAGFGYPAPRVVLVEADASILGGAFLLMQEMPGQPLAQGFDTAIGDSAASKIVRLLAEAPRTIAQISAAWADAHLRLHALPVEPVRRAIENAGLAASTWDSRLAALEVDAAQLEVEILRPIVGWLQVQCPREVAPVLCHGDFHPLNILVAEGRLSGVIDWGNATIADPAFDLGSTLANLSTVPIGGPMLLRPAVKGLIRYALRRYLRFYRQQRAIDMTAVRYYQVYRCAAQVASAVRQPGGAFHSAVARGNLAVMIRSLTGLPVAA